MQTAAGFQAHWLDVDAERMTRYETMFQWDPKQAHFFEGARIEEGLAIADFGCGPGDVAVEFARQVGAEGQVYGLDINPTFLEMATVRAKEASVGKRFSSHLLTDAKIPLQDRLVDRVIARDVLVYVDDPEVTWREFHRILRPGGIAHAIEGDWRMLAVEPVDPDDWRKIMDTAAAWPHPTIGRRLHGLARKAGFQEIHVQVQASPDQGGRLEGFVRNILGYARKNESELVDFVDRVEAVIDQALKDRTYLTVAPKFVVTAIR